MRYNVVVMTIISGLLFCLIMVSGTLSPFPGNDEFNSLGMWMNIGMMLFFYGLSLLLYMAGIKPMTYIMAVFCGIGLLISISILVLSFIFGTVNNNITEYLGLILLCMLATFVNFIWYSVAFSKKQID